LLALDAAFAHWYERAMSARAALKKQARIESREWLRKNLLRGRHWTDIPRRLVPDLGFSAGFWNGHEDDRSVGLDILCGLYSTNACFLNFVNIDLPRQLGKLSQVSRLRALLDLTARAWDPDWAGVMSAAVLDHDYDASRPYVDWLVYVCDAWLPEVPKSFPAVSVEQLSKGKLIVVENEPHAFLEPAHQERIARVREALAPLLKF
jgi:hypothetical protein